jgi:hypothetical protein
MTVDSLALEEFDYYEEVEDMWYIETNTIKLKIFITILLRNNINIYCIYFIDIYYFKLTSNWHFSNKLNNMFKWYIYLLLRIGLQKLILELLNN